MTSGAPKVFISYRREETAGHTGRLYDVISSRFGEGNVFMDVDLAPGVDFVDRITEAVGGCNVLLVIIGPRWAATSSTSTLPRIFEPGDFVRLEVETGLSNSKVAVIPVLVAGAKMPDPTELPAPLRTLTRRNAIELSDTRWRYDVDRLLGTLDRLLADTSAVHRAPAQPAQPPPLPPQPRPQRATPSMSAALLAVTTTVVAALAAVIGRAVANGLRWNPSDDDRWGHVLQPVALQALTWGLVGAAVAVWLTAWLQRRGLAIGALLLGALTGAVAGAAGVAIYRVPRHIPDSPPPDSTLQLLFVVGLALVGALLGALIGSLWRRHGSAGVVVGALAGALVGVFLRRADDSTDSLRIAHALVEALVIVGLVTATRVLLDAREESRSPRAREPTRAVT